VGSDPGGAGLKERIGKVEAGRSVSENGWLLETRGLTKRFGGLVAVDSLPLAILPGEVRGLIGPNGSGKTTTINLLSGLYRADAGAIYLRGERIDRLRPHEITARGVVRTFQIPKLFGNMTVLENVMVPALAALDRGPGPSRAELAARARQLLAFVTLDHLRHALAKELSGGQGMLLQIARGLMVHPSHLFLLDEPFAGVHPTVKDTIMAAILRMNQEEGMTFLIVSHEMTTLRRLCPRVSVMHEGRLIAEGSFEEAANHPRVLEAYLGG
jgi:ABC-type branched-subunit amino acid transport system ATPase component